MSERTLSRSLLAGNRQMENLSESSAKHDQVLEGVIARAISEIEQVFVDTAGRFPVVTEKSHPADSDVEAA